jgi:hypothetical protein
VEDVNKRGGLLGRPVRLTIRDHESNTDKAITYYERAGTLDNAKTRDYLRANKLDLPYGNAITFDKRGLPSPFQYAIQKTNGQTELVWPKSVAAMNLVYPRPVRSK